MVVFCRCSYISHRNWNSSWSRPRLLRPGKLWACDVTHFRRWVGRKWSNALPIQNHLLLYSTYCDITEGDSIVIAIWRAECKRGLITNLTIGLFMVFAYRHDMTKCRNKQRELVYCRTNQCCCLNRSSKAVRPFQSSFHARSKGCAFC